jgi:hypothetical protein
MRDEQCHGRAFEAMFDEMIGRCPTHRLSYSDGSRTVERRQEKGSRARLPVWRYGNAGLSGAQVT